MVFAQDHHYMQSLHPATSMSQRDVSGDGGVLLETKKAGNGVAPKLGQVVFGK